MSKFTFYKAFTLFEAGPPPPAPGGDMGGAPPGGDPMGGGMPMGGGGLGGPPGMGDDPMGGSGGPQGQPIEVKTIAAADVWKLLEKIVKDEKKYGKFFEEIHIAKKEQPTIYSKAQDNKPEKKKSSLMR